MIRWFKNIFKKKRAGYIIITDNEYGLSKRVNKMILERKTIIHTTISKSFGNYGNSETFVLGIYFTYD